MNFWRFWSTTVIFTVRCWESWKIWRWRGVYSTIRIWLDKWCYNGIVRHIWINPDFSQESPYTLPQEVRDTHTLQEQHTSTRHVQHYLHNLCYKANFLIQHILMDSINSLVVQNYKIPTQGPTAEPAYIFPTLVPCELFQHYLSVSIPKGTGRPALMLLADSWILQLEVDKHILDGVGNKI